MLASIFNKSLVLITGLFIFSGCTFQKVDIPNLPVMKVNERSLSTKVFSEKLARDLRKFDALTAKSPKNVERAKNEIIDNFLIQSLIIDFAARNNIIVSEEELTKEVNLVRQSFPDDLSFRKVLADENLSFSEWKESIQISLIQKKVFSHITENISQPSENEIQTFYQSNKERFSRKERIYLRQIVVDDLLKAEVIKDELKSLSFPDLAKKYSISPEGRNGGLVGWVEKGSVDIFDKAFGMPLNSVSQAMESPYGFHIFKVEKKSAATILPLVEVREVIIKELLAGREQAKFAQWLDQQIRMARVFKDKTLIDSITVETQQ